MFCKGVVMQFPFKSSQILCFWQTVVTNCCFGEQAQNKNGYHFLPEGQPLRMKPWPFEIENNIHFLPAHPSHPSFIVFTSVPRIFYYYILNVKLLEQEIILSLLTPVIHLSYTCNAVVVQLSCKMHLSYSCHTYVMCCHAVVVSITSFSNRNFWDSH